VATNQTTELAEESASVEVVSPNKGPITGGDDRWRTLESDREQWDPNQLEPVTSRGTSLLLEFTERREGSFYCMVPTVSGPCNYRNVKKSRMLGHIRKDHLNFRPFRCGGQCGALGW
jgi:hypothetical protein